MPLLCPLGNIDNTCPEVIISPGPCLLKMVGYRPRITGQLFCEYAQQRGLTIAVLPYQAIYLAFPELKGNRPERKLTIPVALGNSADRKYGPS